jgi:hypothetical protein
MKRDMMQLLMEGGIGSVLKIRCRNENDNAKLRASANAITQYAEILVRTGYTQEHNETVTGLK